jgi:hypothetical protein
VYWYTAARCNRKVKTTLIVVTIKDNNVEKSCINGDCYHNKRLLNKCYSQASQLDVGKIFSKRREYTRLFSEHKEYLNLYEIIFVRRVYIYLCLALDLHLNRSKKSAKIQLKKSAKQI